MKVVIDTSSLLSLVRYYLPFDKKRVLYNFIKEKVESGEIVILDKVYEECKYTAKGIVVETLEYLSNIKSHFKTDALLPSPKFFNQLENQFINGAVKSRLSSVEFENRKNAYLNSADAKLLLYGLQNKGMKLDKTIIVTEETEFSNDNKSFKKLPAICKILELEVLTLPKLLALYDGIDFDIIT
nr:DUF4411 family protein [Bacteroidota bacterium]